MNILYSAILLFSSCLFGSAANAEKQEWRFKRGDDENPLHTLVMQQAATIQQLSARLKAVETRLGVAEKQVGFNARFKTSGTAHIVDENVFILDEVDLNLGRGYDPMTGLFTAPVTGLYQFSLHVSHTPPGSIHVHLMKQNNQIAELEASGDDKYMDRSSVTVTTHVAKGERVWAKRADGNVTLVQGAFRTSFTGVLVTPDAP